jgi:hypothetical protein
MKTILDFEISNTENKLNEVVISGTLKPVRRLENPVPVEIITATFLKLNPTANIFDALHNVNGFHKTIAMFVTLATSGSMADGRAGSKKKGMAGEV